MSATFLTIDEVAEYLRLKKQKIYKLAQKGHIPAYKFGREWRFKTERLEQWIEEQESSKRKDINESFKKEQRPPELAQDKKPSLGIRGIQTSLRNKIKLYKERATEIESHLVKKPEEWGLFQHEFNVEVNGFFEDIMNFERISFANSEHEKVYKLKRLFINQIRKLFMRGVYCEWSLRKPFGYAGDFKIIDDICQNNPTTTGLDRLFDNYYQMSAICVAVRNRKEDFKRMVIDFINNSQGRSVRIMNLASGSAREIKEILESNVLTNYNFIIDCYDKEEKALEFAKNLLGGLPNVNFIRENSLRIAAAKDVNSKIEEKYDFIYATGLFDYFNYKISVQLIKNLKKLLKINGILAISNVRDKYSNPSVHFMEWVGDWNLIYRTDDSFRKIFIEAGFKENELKTQHEQQGIMQYVIATNKKRM